MYTKLCVIVWVDIYYSVGKHPKQTSKQYVSFIQQKANLKSEIQCFYYIYIYISN